MKMKFLSFSAGFIVLMQPWALASSVDEQEAELAKAYSDYFNTMTQREVHTAEQIKALQAKTIDPVITSHETARTKEYQEAAEKTANKVIHPDGSVTEFNAAQDAVETAGERTFTSHDSPDAVKQYLKSMFKAHPNPKIDLDRIFSENPQANSSSTEKRRSDSSENGSGEKAWDLGNVQVSPGDSGRAPAANSRNEVIDGSNIPKEMVFPGATNKKPAQKTDEKPDKDSPKPRQ